MRHVALAVMATIGLVACNEPAPTAAERTGPGAPAFAARSSITITDLGTLGGRTSEAWDVNIDGRVVGWSEIASGDHHAFLWTAAGGMQDLGTLGGTTSEARGINGAGDIVGFSASASGGEYAFLRTAAGQMSGLGTPGAAYAINDNQEVVGSNGQAFYWSAGGMQTIATSTWSAAMNLNSFQQLVGYAFLPPGENHAALFTRDPDGTWKASDLGTLGGGSESQAHSINANGEIVGLSRIASGSVHAFVWTDPSRMVDLGALPKANRADAYDINNAGVIVGESRVNLTNYAVVWTKGATGWTVQQLPSLGNSVGDSWANAINNSSPALVAGFSTAPGKGHHAVLWTLP